MQQQVTNLLEELNIPFSIVSHPAVYTVEESAKHIKDKLPVKNLLLQDIKTGGKVLVIMAGNERLDTKTLAKTLGYKRFQFAKPEVLKQTLGVEPGAVSLFGLLHPGSDGLKVAVDKRLAVATEIGFHPNDNTQTIFMPGSAIEKILRATGHSYQILEVL